MEPENNSTTTAPETLRKVEEALKFIDPNIEREQWVKVKKCLRVPGGAS